MPVITNKTPCTTDNFSILDQHSVQFELFVASATFSALPGKPLCLAEKQVPVRPADEYYGEPGLSNIRYEADTALEKPCADVIVNGSAVPPGGKKAEKVMVSLRIGNLSKELSVSGNRFWQRGIMGLSPSSPKPFDTMPIIYERAFGGMDTRASAPDKRHSDPRNPIGVGFRGALSQHPHIDTEIPNVEYPSTPVSSPKDLPAPAGFGIVGRNWQPRIGFAGTYDDVWKAEQCPLLPLDFDPRYYQAAPSDQQLKQIEGGEIVRLVNMTPESVWQFQLPTIEAFLLLVYDDRDDEAVLWPDTVLLRPDSHEITITLRAKIPLKRNRSPLREIILDWNEPV